MNLGCGFDIKEGWFNTNYFSHEPVKDCFYLDARTEHLDMIGKLDFILVNHVLCTLAPQDADKVLRNCYLWLKDGGTLQVIDMDILKIFKSYQEERYGDIPIQDGNSDWKLCMALSGYGTRLSLYTPKRMEDAIVMSGFRTVERKRESEHDSRPLESLILEATK